ncbi:MAG: hypothetical protein ACFFDW_02625 [Candidatus Thorarchaeota archaeon]
MEKTICSQYTVSERSRTTEITIRDLFKRQAKFIERFLVTLAQQDELIIEKLLKNYKETLSEFNIKSNKNKFTKKYAINYTEFKLLTKFSEYIPLIENAVLFFLNFIKYENKLSEDDKINVLRLIIFVQIFILFIILFFH